MTRVKQLNDAANTGTLQDKSQAPVEAHVGGLELQLTELEDGKLGTVEATLG